MEIFRRGVILTQEEDVANKLKELPNNWLCIGGDGNRFSFKKGEGVQIDFIVISPKGILLIDAKNIHTIELIDGNTIRFLNAEGKQISKNKKRDNPIDDVIDDRYQAKDWLRERGLEDFLTKDKKDLKVFIHSIVVIANENNVQYKNCKLEQLSYYTHKYPSLIPLSNLNKDFFDSLYLPQNCKELSHEEMWTLFKIFYNPDMTITQILNEIRKEEDTLFQEKQVFLEKMRLLEQENIGLNKKVVDLEGTRNNLMSVNQALTNDIEKTNDEKEKIKNKLNSIETENRKLYEDNNELLKYKEYEIQLEDYREKYNESRKSIEQLENDINKLRSKKEKENIRIFKKRIIRYRIIFVPLIILLFVGWLMFFIMPSNDGIINADKTLSTIELIFPKIKDYYKESKYKELIKFWDNKVLMNGKKDFSLKDYLQYNIVFYYIAESYQKTEAYKEAVKYYDIFAELTRSPDNLIKIYFNRSISLLELKSELDRAIFDLKEALRLVENRPDKDSKWNIRILWTLGLTYKVISTDVSEAKKRYYTKRLGISNFLEETINYFKKGADLSLQSDDIPFWIKFQTEIGDIYRAQKKYQNAIQVYEYLASMLQSQLERTEDDYITIMVAYNDIGGCYSLMDRVLLAESNYQKALKLNEEYSQYITNPKRKIYEALFNQNLGSLYYRLKWYERSLQPLKKAYEIAKELNLPQLGIYEKKYKDVQKKLK